MTVLPGLSPRSSLVIAITRRRHSARNTCARAWTRPRARTCPRPQSLTASLVRSTPPGGCTSRLASIASAERPRCVRRCGLRPCTRCLSDRRCFVRCTERLARPCGQQVVVPAERVVGAVSKHPDRFLDGERVTRDAHRRLLWRLLALGELRGNRDLLPGRDDRTAVAVVVLFGGWIVAFRRVLVGGHRPHVGGIDGEVKSSRPRQAACSTRRSKTSSTTCSRSVRKRSTASLDGGRSKPQLSQTTVFWSSRVTGRMP